MPHENCRHFDDWTQCWTPVATATHSVDIVELEDILLILLLKQYDHIIQQQHVQVYQLLAITDSPV